MGTDITGTKNTRETGDDSRINCLSEGGLHHDDLVIKARRLNQTALTFCARKDRKVRCLRDGAAELVLFYYSFHP